MLSKKVGKPVKVVWSREDDIRFDYFHSVAALYMKAAIGPNGMPTAWLQRTVYPPIASTFDPNATYATDEMSLGWNNLPFDIPNHRSENGPANAYVRIGWLRSVANIYHAFAIHSFVDELAAAAGKDPVEYLLQLIGPARIVPLEYSKEEAEEVQELSARHRAPAATSLSWWPRNRTGRSGRARRAAASVSQRTAASSPTWRRWSKWKVDGEGQVTIPNVWTAVDAGTIVSPDNVRNQLEGAAAFGASLALTSEITVTNGVVTRATSTTMKWRA